ncbi:hypothetical protein NLG97_g3861 [Lecanicillium saksenae]|uniref:Uncharacterized protein n=1 Tax=Lecanicillium saksenae TaxID=468837 RepID=A0ACC1R078_9HYPO|nr:hypothetical protein NLG97_g3861 [Lecanicillium saksenae]
MSLLRSLLFYGASLRRFADVDGASVSATNGSCNYGDKLLFNSTGMASFAAPVGTTNSSKPWYLSVALIENSAAGNSTPDTPRSRNGYMSVPNEVAIGLDSNATKLCAYIWEAKDAKASKDGSCKQVFSDMCLKYIQDFSPIDDSCPSLGSNYECNNFAAIGSPLDFTGRRNCSANLHSLAGIPDGYTTRGVFSFSDVGNHFDSVQEFEAEKKKPVPVLLLFSTRHNMDSYYSIEYHHQLLCIAPTNVTAGNESPGSAATNFRASKGSLVAVIVATMLGFLF